MLLKHIHSLTTKVDEFGWSPLHYAAQFDLVYRTTQLLEADKFAAYIIAEKDDNKTPLHVAVCEGSIEVIKQLLKYCPDCWEMTTSKGQNVVHLAVLCERKQVGAFIFTYSWAINLENEKDDEGITPTHLYDTTHQMQREEKKKISKEDQKLANTHLIVAALIVTVTFAAGFTVPGGYDGNDGPNKGIPVLAREAAFKAFIVSDTIAFTSSTFAVFLHFLASMYEVEDKMGNRYVSALLLLIISLPAMMVAFMTGLYTVLAPSSLGLAVSICVFDSLCILIFVWLVCRLFATFLRYYLEQL